MSYFARYEIPRKGHDLKRLWLFRASGHIADEFDLILISEQPTLATIIIIIFI